MIWRYLTDGHGLLHLVSFIPLGFLARLRYGEIGLAIEVCFYLAIAIEATQFEEHWRKNGYKRHIVKDYWWIDTIADVGSDIAGCLIGIILYGFIK